ncbi:glycosyltransferase family 2 protein [Neolewinella agarilytica]|uniref:Glycosyl transferase family 2 n=1 Tax=Neolewinella agarilytica TaxID=478744 RepID=A0A1H9J2V1_9BACT|nr:glycosyltransferase family 2 protein [Neolewinella agarilytica]SEQ81106.1 Glycosyl transferase family 2 [Neolewinella agarilytica]
MLVSIIIPAYNAEKFIQRSIQSALEQDYEDTEIIIVDNNSSDKTVRKVKQLIEPYHNDKIRLINCAKQGCSAARNRGIEVARGTWIQFLDADDTLKPNKISFQISRVKVSTRWVISSYRHIYPDKESIDTLVHQDPWKGLVLDFRAGYTCSNLYHTDALRLVKGWNETIPDNTDPDLHLRLLKADIPWQLIPEVLTFYHHDNPGKRVSIGQPVGGNARRLNILNEANHHLATTKPAYWKNNKNFFLGALVKAIRMLATHDLQQATKYYDKLVLKADKELQTKQYEIVSSLIIRSYKHLGFENTEKLRLKLTPYLPNIFKSWAR